jgi:NAD(P)-dependent dehydrogenase (short-subunit alcohol dehydrogenase family)
MMAPLAGQTIVITGAASGIGRALARRLSAHGSAVAIVDANREALVRTTPERAAAIIHRGVDAGKARILVGPDAYLFDFITRLTPTHYWTVLNKLEEFAVRAAEKRTQT